MAVGMTLKTEDQARQCWCPFVREKTSYETSTWAYAAGVNRQDVQSAWPTCIASDCMAWRQAYESQALPGHHYGAEIRTRLVETDKGYCGLAGKP